MLTNRPIPLVFGAVLVLSVAGGSHAGTDSDALQSASCPDSEVRVYMLGDEDDYEYEGPGSEDDVYIDPAWWLEVTTEHPGDEFDFDQVSRGGLIPFSFVFDLADGEGVTGAWLTLRLKQNGGQPWETDFILLDQLQPQRLLVDLGWDGTPSVLSFDLSDVLGDNLLPLLADGLLNCAVYDDSAIDYATLELHVAPPCYDLRYECRIVNEPSVEDQSPELPGGLTELPAGETFFVEFWASDSGDVNTGVVSAYADLDYPEELVTCYEPQSSPLFSLFPDGVCDGTIVDELGGSQLDPGIGVEPEWARIAVGEYTADAVGQAEFALLPADTESSAHGRGLILPEDIDYGTCTVEIVCPCIYDLDANCNIAAGDLGLFAPCWGCCDDQPCWDEHTCQDKDFDCNGCVSGGDLAWFAAGWNKSCNDIDPVADYPPCRECEGPVYCADAAATQSSGGIAAGPVLAGDLGTTEDVVELAVSLRRDNRSDYEVDQLDVQNLRRVTAGERVFAEVWAKDFNPSSQGLTAVFADLYFDSGQFRVVSVDPGDTFTLFAESDLEGDFGVVRGLGGATMEPNHGTDRWTRVSVVELQALVDGVGPTVIVRPIKGEAVSRYAYGLVTDVRVKESDNSSVQKRSKVARDGRAPNAAHVID